MIVLVRSDGLLPKMIHFGMWLFNIKTRRPTSIVYNHAEVFLPKYGIVSGAIGKGISNRSWANAFYKDGKARSFIVYDLKLTEEQEEKLKNFCLEMEGTKYEVSNFWHHAKRIFTGNWTGKQEEESDKKLYCTEYAAKAINHIFPGMIEKPWQINPVEFKEFLDENFEKVKRIYKIVNV